MIQAPFNNVIVSVETKYIRNITNVLRMSAIQQGASVDPADCVQIVGDVVSLPKAIDNKQEHIGFSCSDIKVGDKAIFSHSVIYSFEQTAPDADPVYKNLFYYQGREYFVCDIQYIFGVIRNGEIIMVNGYSMIYDFADPKIILATNSKKALPATTSELMYIGSPKTKNPILSITPGETAVFNPSKTTKYQIAGKPFRIIQQAHLLGFEHGTGQVE